MDCESAYRIERLDDLERHLCEIADSMGNGEAFKDVLSPEFFLSRSEIGLRLGGVTLSPTTGELFFREY